MNMTTNVVSLLDTLIQSKLQIFVLFAARYGIEATPWL